MNEHHQLPEPAPMSSKKRIWLFCLGVALLLIATGIYAYEHFQESKSEQQAYTSLMGSYAIKDYEDFLESYPDSKHKQEVSRRLADLRAKETAWLQIVGSSSVQDFVSFKNRFRDPRYDQWCDTKIDSLDWVRAQKENSSEAYEIYLQTHPNGKYTTQANNALSASQAAQINAEEERQIINILVDFYAAFAQNDPIEMCQYITPVMEQFLHRRNANKSDVIQIVNQMFSPEIENCFFHMSNDVKVEPMIGTRGNKGYKATFTLDQRIVRTNEGKTFGSYATVVLLDAQKMITSVTMKELSKIENE